MPAVKEISPLADSLSWLLKDEPLTMAQLGLEVAEPCTPATNGSSANARYTKLSTGVPAPGVTLPTLQSALKIIRDTLSVVVGEGDDAKRWTIPEARYLVDFSSEPSLDEATGTISALLTNASFGATELANKTTSTATFLAFVRDIAVSLFYEHVFDNTVTIAPSMATLVHLRRIQTVGFGLSTRAPIVQLRGFIRAHSIVSRSLQQAPANDMKHYFVACWRCEDLLQGRVTGSMEIGEAWVEDCLQRGVSSKPTSQNAFVALCSQYIQAMNVPTAVLEGDEPTVTPLDPAALWSTPLSKAHVSPPKPRAGPSAANGANNVAIDVSNGDVNQGGVNQGDVDHLTEAGYAFLVVASGLSFCHVKFRVVRSLLPKGLQYCQIFAYESNCVYSSYPAYYRGR